MISKNSPARAKGIITNIKLKKLRPLCNGWVKNKRGGKTFMIQVTLDNKVDHPYDLCASEVTWQGLNNLKIGDTIEFDWYHYEVKDTIYNQNLSQDYGFFVNGIDVFKELNDLHKLSCVTADPLKVKLKSLLSYPGRERLDIDKCYQILEKQNFKCAISGFPLTVDGDYALSIDCIEPHHTGGEYVHENIHFVALKLNLTRGSLTLNKFKAIYDSIGEFVLKAYIK